MEGVNSLIFAFISLLWLKRRQDSSKCDLNCHIICFPALSLEGDHKSVEQQFISINIYWDTMCVKYCAGRKTIKVNNDHIEQNVPTSINKSTRYF